MNNIKFTILIPTYNRINFVKKTINSVLEQDYKYYNIIISDNNSSDGTYNELLKLYRQENITIYKQNTNIGFAKNLNFLLDKAINDSDSDYITILSDDDMLEREYLKRIAQVIANTKCKFIFTNAFLIDKDDHIVGQFVNSKIPKTGSLKKLLSLKSNPINLNTLSISLDLIKKIGFMDIEMKEVVDYDYWLRCANKNIDYFYIEEKLVKYRIHVHSLTNLSNESLLISTLKTLKKNNINGSYDFIINITIINFILNNNLNNYLIKELFPEKSILVFMVYKTSFLLKHVFKWIKIIKNKLFW